MFYYDETALGNAKASYEQYAADMKALRELLTGDVKDLKTSAWQSKAADAFFTKFDDEWKKNMKKYEDVINHMADNMKIAIDTYQPVWDEAEELGL